MAEVVSLGIHILDILGRPVNRIPPRQDVDLLEEIRLTVAGTAAGASVDMAKLGVDLLAMGAVGEDAAGAFIVDTMGRFGIDTSALVRKPGVQTSASMLAIRPNGERPALHVLGANAALTEADIDLDAIASAKHLHFGGVYLMPQLDGAPTARILKHAQDHGVPVSLDLIALDRPDLLQVIEPCLPYVDYFMPGLEEAKMISGLDDRHAVIAFFLDLGVKTTVFKMGAEGSSIGWRDEQGALQEIRVPALRANVVDSTGCGDAYCAGFIAGLLRGWDIVECAKLGTAAAGLVITGLGSDAGIVDFEQTVAFMQSGEPLPMTD